MRFFNISGLIIILLFVNSCSSINLFDNPSKKETFPNNNTSSLNVKKNLFSKCSEKYIPTETSVLKNKYGVNSLKLYGVTLNCSRADIKENDKYYNLNVNFSIYYQILTKDLKLDQNDLKIFIALVDEDNYKIISKIISKVDIKKAIKIKNKRFLINKETIRIKLNKKSSLTFYFGFQN